MGERFKWTVEIEVDAIWIADGFDLTEYVRRTDGAADALCQLGDAARWWRFHECSVKVIAAPDPDAIRREQGEMPTAQKVFYASNYGTVVWIDDGTLMGCEEGDYARKAASRANAFEITAPESQEFLDEVNAHFGTAYRLAEFSGR